MPNPPDVSSALILFDFFAKFNNLAQLQFLSSPIFAFTNCCLQVFLLLFLKHTLSFPTRVLFLHVASLNISVLQSSISGSLPLNPLSLRNLVHPHDLDDHSYTGHSNISIFRANHSLEFQKTNLTASFYFFSSQIYFSI